MSTTNNLNELRNRLSEMDKIFIPEDLDENVSLEDLMNYQQNVKFWRTVPKNYSLVKQNIFTQEVNNVAGHGIKFVAPLVTKTILVSRNTGVKTYNDIECFSNDGIALKVAFSIVMKISNPAKYIVEGKNQIKHLDGTIKRLLLGYISSKGFEHVVTGTCQINLFDPRDELNEFSNRYGINIESVLIEKVTLPENLRKLYNDKAEELQKRQAQTIRLAAEKEKAENDAVINKINAKAEAEKISLIENAKAKVLVEKLAQISASLQKEGLPKEQISQAIRTYIMAETGNVIFAGDNLGASNIAAGIVGSQQAMQEQDKPNTRTRHQ